MSSRATSSASAAAAAAATGRPRSASPTRVLRDVLEGKVSAERAREEYRVAIADRRIDEQATIELRRPTSMSVRLAIDIGGTFTDATLIDEETGEVSIAKVLTTPVRPVARDSCRPPSGRSRRGRSTRRR